MADEQKNAQTTREGPLAVERPALYYPFVHVYPEQEPWLKATLLLHPSIIRMVPPDYDPQDPPNLQPYTTKQGSASRPLLDDVRTDLQVALAAKTRLRQTIEANIDYCVAHFTQAHAGGNETPIQYSKIDDDFLYYLEHHGLAWQSNGKGRYGTRQWRGLHPRLASAIMSTLAVSIGTHIGTPIITPDGDLHEELLASTEDDIFLTLTNMKPEPAPQAQAVGTELGQLVITTAINLDKLRIEDIVELQTQKIDLRAFRDYLLEHTARIGAIPDPDTRQTALRTLNAEVQDQWADFQRSLPKRLGDVFAGASALGSSEVVDRLTQNATNEYVIYAATAVKIGLLAYQGRRVFKDFRAGQPSPLKYLSSIKAKANTYTTFSTSPLALGFHINFTKK